jgi:hypothetical protein
MKYNTLGQLIYQSNCFFDISLSPQEIEIKKESDFIINSLDQDRLIYNKILEPLEL